jgi:hypothetical protein
LFFFFRYRASRDTCTHIDEIILKSYRMHTTVWISDRTITTQLDVRQNICPFPSRAFSHNGLIDVYWLSDEEKKIYEEIILLFVRICQI